LGFELHRLLRVADTMADPDLVLRQALLALGDGGEPD
jgi:hypothetical protein